MSAMPAPTIDQRTTIQPAQAVAVVTDAAAEVAHAAPTPALLEEVAALVGAIEHHLAPTGPPPEVVTEPPVVLMRQLAVAARRLVTHVRRHPPRGAPALTDIAVHAAALADRLTAARR